MAPGPQSLLFTVDLKSAKYAIHNRTGGNTHDMKLWLYLANACGKKVYVCVWETEIRNVYI